MSRTKEAVLILVDAGPSMGLPLRAKNSAKNKAELDIGLQRSRFAAAVETVENIIQQKVVTLNE
ncbi:hypothetical protein PsorP6_008542 [Peronosclerospora sorghi]|uniref:Uncharacterized protein n=1 Tax=Peronosclerospora sorghi TaxID=230839 RepID=A0ACC0WCB0_9STRA|nr:hypothetical protein PsorP6_008542 [Peronosclerospora sorghi]